MLKPTKKTIKTLKMNEKSRKFWLKVIGDGQLELGFFF